MSDDEKNNLLRFVPPQAEVSDYISPEDQLQFYRERLRTVSLALRTAEMDLTIAREAITALTSFSAASHRDLEARLAAAERELAECAAHRAQLHLDVAVYRDQARAAERERDELRAALSGKGE